MNFELSSDTLNISQLRQGLDNVRAGAINIFEGRVRNHNQSNDVIALEYEAHLSLCETEAGKVISEAQEKFDILDCHCVHRIGRLNVGEIAVWIGVSSEHRRDAMQACQFIIDEIKHRLPIWKKEYYQNGDSGWINCEHCKMEKPSNA